MEDSRLLSMIEGAQKGDRNSQELLYRQFYSYSLGICLRYTKNREEAVEILNDSFLSVFKYLGKFDLTKPFIPWLRKIMINAAINHFKREQKNLVFTELKNGYHVVEENPTGLENLQYEETLKLIQSLSPMYRTVFNLYVMEGFTHVEIAEMLGISEGASKSNLSRARSNLRTLLKGTYEEKYSGTD